MTEIRQNTPQAADPLQRLNDPADVFKNVGQLEFIRFFLRLLRDALGKAIYRDQSTPHITMISPGGKSYRVTVDEAGALKTEYIRG